MRFAVIAAIAAIALPSSAFPTGAKKQHAQRRTELSTEAQYYADTCANHWGVPRELMRAVMIQESGGNPVAQAHKNKSMSRNGQGLMQLLPGTAARYGVSNTFNPGDNACGGAHYLADLIHEFGDLREVVAAYYAGEHHLEAKGLKYSNPDVVAYVKSVHALYDQELKKEGVYDETASR